MKREHGTAAGLPSAQPGEYALDCGFIGAVGLGPQMMNIDGDLGRHLTIGGYILDPGKVPLADLFSHTMPGAELTPHEWLSQVLFALAERWLGLNGVVLLTAVVIAWRFCVYRRALREGGSILAALAVCILALAASSLHWLTRPHVFTFLLVAVWLDGLERLRQGTKGVDLDAGLDVLVGQFARRIYRGILCCG